MTKISDATLTMVKVRMKLDSNQSSLCPLSSTICSAPRPSATKPKPEIVNFQFASLRRGKSGGSWIRREVRISDRIPTGMLTKKDPAPGVVVSDPSAERWTDGRRHDHRNAVNRESHAALCRRKRVGQDGLLTGLQPAAADALQDAEDNQQPRFGAKPQSSELTVNSTTQIM